MGTPAFAMVYGMGLCFFSAHQADRNNAQLTKRMRMNARVIFGGVALIAAMQAWRETASGADFGPLWPEQLFYGVLLFYAFMLLTSAFWLKIVMRFRDRVFASLIVAAAAYACHDFAFWLFPENPFTGWASLGWHMLAAPYAYPRLLGAVFVGFAIGSWLEHYDERPVLLNAVAKCGAALALVGFALAINLDGGWPDNSGSLALIPAFAGLLLLFYFIALTSASQESRSIIFRFFVICGMLAFPIFVGHGLVSPARDILELYSMPGLLALVLPVLIFLIALALIGLRLNRLVFIRRVR